MDTTKKVIKKGIYDYATSVDTAGDAIGHTGSYLLAYDIPAGAVVTAVYFKATTAVTTGGGQTMNLKVVDDAGSPNTITLTDTAQGAASVFGTNAAGSIALSSSATGIYVGTNSNLYVVIGTAAVTAGHVTFYVEYILP